MTRSLRQVKPEPLPEPSTYLKQTKELFLVYIAISFATLTSLVTLQYCRHNILGTCLFLGWDAPGYVWSAMDVIKHGSFLMTQRWGFPHLYIQVLAFFGYLGGSISLLERILPIAFAFLLTYLSSLNIFKITRNVHIAGLNAFLSVLLPNYLLLVSDLHSDLMALSLSLGVFFMFSGFDNEKRILSKRSLIIIILLTLVVFTHLEIYVLLSVTLVFQGIFTKNLMKAAAGIVFSAIPLVLLAPMLMSKGSVSTQSLGFSTGNPLVINGVVSWLVSSPQFLFFIALGAIFLSYNSVKKKDELSQLILLWAILIVALFLSTGLQILPFPHVASIHLLAVMPVSMLVSLSSLTIAQGLRNLKLHFRIVSVKRDHRLAVSIQKLITTVLIAILVISTAFSASQYVDGFLNPHISSSTYAKIKEAQKFFQTNRLEIPVVLFHGESTVQLGSLVRLYIGAELGEHFAYYGIFDNLLSLVPGFDDGFQDSTLLLTAETLSKEWYDEMQGRNNTQWPHSSFITDFGKLRSHPILIISPDLYDATIPYHFRPFQIGNGVYVIPPNSITENTGILLGPEVRVIRDGLSFNVRSEYLNVDPMDSSAVYVIVNASLGYKTYNITGFPSYWVFDRLVQGGDLSFPEHNPERPSGELAIEGNDPAETEMDWRMPMNGSITIDTSSRKEGSASLRVTGAIDYWGNLGVAYDPLGSWNMSKYSSMAVWFRSNESIVFSVALVDSSGHNRVFFETKAGESSGTTEWKRFIINLNEPTEQGSGFDISSVDFIFLYVYSNVKGEAGSFWLDDLTLDDSVDIHTDILKARVMSSDSVVAYFKEDER